MDVEKAIFFFFIFYIFIHWFEAFTIQKSQIKLKILNPRPKISLETKFQPKIFELLIVFFSRTAHFFWFGKF